MARKTKTDSEEPLVEGVKEEAAPTEMPKDDNIYVNSIDVKFESNKEAEEYMERLLDGTMDEIARCDEYILSKMDSYRRFQTYKDELYLYRYKVHQMRFHPEFPHIRPKDFPERPEYVPDQ